MAKISHNYELFKVKDKLEGTLGGVSRFVLEHIQTGTRRAYKIQRINKHKSGLPGKAAVYRVKGERLNSIGTFELGLLYSKLPFELAITSFDDAETAENKREQIKKFIPAFEDFEFIGYEQKLGLHVTLGLTGGNRPRIYDSDHLDFNPEQLQVLTNFLQHPDAFNVYHLGYCGICGKPCENTKTLVIGFGGTCHKAAHARMNELIKVSNNSNMMAGFRQFLNMQTAIDAGFTTKLSNKDFYLQIKQNVTGKQNAEIQEVAINSGLTLDNMTCVSILYLQYISELDRMQIFEKILNGSTEYESEFIINSLGLL